MKTGSTLLKLTAKKIKHNTPNINHLFGGDKL